MKKSLLTLAIAGATIFGASAQMNFSDCFTVKYNDKAYQPGETIYCSHWEDVSDIYGDDYITYECFVDIENQDIMPAFIKGTLMYSYPTYAETLTDWTLGSAQLCFESKSSTGAMLGSGCLMGDFLTHAGTGIEKVAADGAGTFQWQIHLSGVLNSIEETYVLVLQAVEEDGTAVSKSANFPIVFSTVDSGVDEIGVDNAPGEWYDLQGRRVAEPAKGLYIYKTAGKAVKRIVK